VPMNRISAVCAPFFPVKARRWWPLLCFCCCCCCREGERRAISSRQLSIYIFQINLFSDSTAGPCTLLSLSSPFNALLRNIPSSSGICRVRPLYHKSTMNFHRFPRRFHSSRIFRSARYDQECATAVTIRFFSFMTKWPQSIGRKEQRDQSKSSRRNVEVSCKWINSQWTRVSGHRFGLHNPTTSIHII
jgi:hypothetical protein